MKRVDILFSQPRPGEPLLSHYSTMRRFSLLYFVGSARIRKVEQAEHIQWLKDNNIDITLEEDYTDFYYMFPNDEDATAFRLRFGL